MEEGHKYWLQEKDRKCVFCKQGEDTIEHYVQACRTASEWFAELGERKEERYVMLVNDKLSNVKERVIKRLWQEKERASRNRNRNS